MSYNAIIFLPGKCLEKEFPTIKEAAEAITALEEKTPGTKAVYILTELSSAEIELLLLRE